MLAGKTEAIVVSPELKTSTEEADFGRYNLCGLKWIIDGDVARSICFSVRIASRRLGRSTGPPAPSWTTSGTSSHSILIN
jgi:hypothetical protein